MNPLKTSSKQVKLIDIDRNGHSCLGVEGKKKGFTIRGKGEFSKVEMLRILTMVCITWVY